MGAFGDSRKLDKGGYHEVLHAKLNHIKGRRRDLLRACARIREAMLLLVAAAEAPPYRLKSSTLHFSTEANWVSARITRGVTKISLTQQGSAVSQKIIDRVSL